MGAGRACLAAFTSIVADVGAARRAGEAAFISP
jgi:hypothetical protein